MPSERYSVLPQLWHICGLSNKVGPTNRQVGGAFWIVRCFSPDFQGPTFVAIALGMLINLGMYESITAEALHGILFYLSGLLSLLAGLAIVSALTMRVP